MESEKESQLKNSLGGVWWSRGRRIMDSMWTAGVRYTRPERYRCVSCLSSLGREDEWQQGWIDTGLHSLNAFLHVHFHFIHIFFISIYFMFIEFLRISSVQTSCQTSQTPLSCTVTMDGDVHSFYLFCFIYLFIVFINVCVWGGWGCLMVSHLDTSCW